MTNSSKQKVWPESFTRLRFQDNRLVESPIVRQEVYGRSSCISTSPLVWTQNWSGTFGYVHGSYKSMTDVVVPGFRTRSKAGELFFNPSRAASWNVAHSPGPYIDQVKSSTLACSGTPSLSYYPESRRVSDAMDAGLAYAGSLVEPDVRFDGALYLPRGTISPGAINHLVRVASTKARSEFGRGNTNDLWETIGESQKSARLLHSAASELNKFAKQNAKVFSLARASGNAWLLYRYGLRPLISSVKDAIEGLEANVGKLRQTYRGTAKLDNLRIDSYTTPLWGIYNATYTLQDYESVSVSSGILAEYIATLSSNVGLSFKNLLTLPYELLPYSFVVDWGINLGSYLGSLAPALGYKELGAWTTIRRDFVRNVTVSTTPSGSYWNQATTPINTGCMARWTEVQRIPRVAAGTLEMMPSLKLDNGIRLADAAALFINRLKFG